MIIIINKTVKLAGQLFRDSEDKRVNVLENVSRYIKNENQVSGHKKYAYGYIFYLCMHILNVIFNFYLLDVFIDGDFLNLGSLFVSLAFF